LQPLSERGAALLKGLRGIFLLVFKECRDIKIGLRSMAQGNEKRDFKFLKKRFGI
jgi:hypothetical protein